MDWDSVGGMHQFFKPVILHFCWLIVQFFWWISIIICWPIEKSPFTIEIEVMPFYLKWSQFFSIKYLFLSFTLVYSWLSPTEYLAAHEKKRKYKRKILTQSNLTLLKSRWKSAVFSMRPRTTNLALQLIWQLLTIFKLGYFYMY